VSRFSEIVPDTVIFDDFERQVLGSYSICHNFPRIFILIVIIYRFISVV
jgi:hypothetical protein